jgi:uncharacterized protein (UPF0248 family)
MKKVRDFLNKILWDKRERPEDYEITFIYRGAHMNRRTIPCKSITGVKRSWFIYRNEVGEDVVIPFHRVTEIRNVKNNEVAYKSRKEQTQ